MSSYDCYNAEGEYRISYPDDAVGYLEFRNLLERLGMFAEPSDEDPLSELRLLYGTRSRIKLRCPRVFVSHRQCDKKEALRVAWLANKHGFDYWLDILDPATAAAGSRPHSNANQQAILVAAIVEMALLNCTHVFAIMTANVRGTMWMPYEFGRVKDSRLISTRVAAWFDSSWNISNTPEYFQLGRQFEKEPDIERWMDGEFALWCVRSPYSPKYCPSRPWPFPNRPDPLP